MNKEYERAKERVELIHNLAVRFYLMMGYDHKKEHGYLFDSQHPTELLMWDMAVYAYRDIDGLDGDEYLDEMREFEDE